MYLLVSVCAFLIKKGEIPSGLSIKFDLIRYKNDSLSELEAGLNAERFKGGGGRLTGVSVGA